MTHDVSLPINQKIKFPAICVVCEKQTPDSEVGLDFIEHKFSTTEAASTLLGSTTYHVENPSHQVKGIPACKGCAQKLKSHHRWQKVINYTLWSVGIALAIFLPVEIWLKIVLLVGFLILPIIVSFIFPPAFNLTISKETMTFEFMSETYANKFKKLNQTLIK